ncbi:MAG TPA: AAA family ATPase [Stellaceae bacterium]|nr:AAA family ATPase [Stellaceae bacterium]
MSRVSDWLDAVGLGEHADAFEHHAIDLDQLGDLTDKDLQELGLPIGHRKRFLHARIESPATAAAQATGGSRERRHITVMFCDLVGSVELGERLEAEDLLTVLRRYHDICRDAVGRYGGLVARFVGDGVMSYFGHPVAHENDAERAVRAALEILRGIGDRVASPPDAKLRARIGIASGLVLVGDLFEAGVDAQNAIVGTVPNHAARIQVLAPPNGVVLAHETWRLVRHMFDFQDLGLQPLRGITEPVRLWLVTGERADKDRPPGVRPMAVWTPMVNRKAELGLLDDFWETARQGRGQALLLRGEAGIGKSRLVAQFLADLNPPARTAQFSCSPFLSSSLLGPLVGYLSRLAHIERDDPLESKQAKLERVALGTPSERKAAISTFDWLLSLPDPHADEVQATPRQRRARALAVLTQQLVRSAETGPFIAVMEDLQWADPTTLELIERVLDELSGRPILAILTSREDFTVPWRARPGLTVTELARLPPDDCTSLMRQLVGSEALGQPIMREILRKTDGIPLFVEEFTRSAIEALQTPSGAVAAEPVRIPATLYESLLVRLDRAGPGKGLAQLCAVVGRSASRDFIQGIARMSTADLERARDALTRAGILYVEVDRRGVENYVFKHALVQEAAYASLVRERRQEAHCAVADALSKVSPDVVELHPELLAHHLTEGGRVEVAIQFWLKAARRGLQRSGNLEATIQLRRGLQLLDRPEMPPHPAMRLEFLTLLASALISVKGPGTAEVERLYAEAIEICRSIPEAPGHFPVYWGWWRISRDFFVMQRRADDLLTRAKARRDDALLLQAHHCQWASHFNTGDFAASAGHIDLGLRIYAAGDYVSHASLYGNHDAKVCGHGELALILWLTGHPNRALEEEQVSLGWAERIAHAGSRSHALDIALTHGVYRRDARRVLELAESTIRFAEDQGFSNSEAKGFIYRGWAKALLGDSAGGLRELEAGIQRQRDIGTTEDFPIYYSMLAEALMLAGRVDAAMDCVQGARKDAANTGLAIWMPELWRWSGVLVRRIGSDAIAEADLRQALEISRQQGARALELRAAIDLADLKRAQGDISGALALLEPLHHACAEGGETSDLSQVAALIKEFRDAGRH